ncbi:MAG: translational GTPase TypA [Deltaproteobacteria bacterium]|jgi:GTP-binding protein|nr:translational GTPase TypA [Deltaproteobacteria bacterium]
MNNNNLRNIAIIAHVDHGKTTLVDFMLKQSGTFRVGAEVSDRIMDSLDLERERGITIAAKNCSVYFGNTKINIVDTPGHADFGGEVERALQMVDGAILLVDASEGPLPQTRFVLKKALELHLKIIVVVNKIDRSDARPSAVLDEVYDLFIDLGANDNQIEFPVIYAIGRDGIAKRNLTDSSSDLKVLFETIVETIPMPKYHAEKPLQFLVSNIGYSDYLGRLAIGRLMNGQLSMSDKDSYICVQSENQTVPVKLSSIQIYKGLKFEAIEEVAAGDVVVLAGIENVEIGDTVCKKDKIVPLKRILVEEPTISMKFTINSSPFAGLDGKFVQSRKILERLQKEVLHNVALKLECSTKSDEFIVKGRGELQMAILIEQMRREGFELSVGRPQIIFKKDGSKTLEPIEHLFIDCDEVYTGVLTEKLALRKGRMVNLANNSKGRVRLEFNIPSRGLIGFRSDFLTDTRGTGIMSSYLLDYEEYRGEIESRSTGSLVSDRAGEAVAYGLFHLEPRGQLFVVPNDRVYEGMIVGEHNRSNDLDVNPCKTKKLSNMRAAGKDDNILLTPVLHLSLERALEFIKDDELVEVTPNHIRLRKSILPANLRWQSKAKF